VQSKQKLERVSSELAGRAGSDECTLNSFVPFRSLLRFFVSPLSSRRD